MEKRLIQKLLSCVQTTEERFTLTTALLAFSNEHRTIGRRRGNSFYLSPADKETIRALLRAENVDPETSPDAWDNLTRSEALSLGTNEKFASSPVRRRRVAIKALVPGRPVFLNGAPCILPPRCHVEADFDEIDVSSHDEVVVVENWEAFLDVHVAAERLEFPGLQPLAVWRGDTSAVRADGMLTWLEQLSQPVSAFVDLDPAGLVIAAGLPRLSSVVAPEYHELEAILREDRKGRRDLFLNQLAGSQRLLDESTNPHIRPLWETIRRAGKGLPQEYFCCP